MAAAPARAVDRTTWHRLLRTALEVIDSLSVNGYGKLDFRLGGGTVLMFRFDHRLSKDIDIFTHDAQALSFLTPRLNAISEAASISYEEQANAIKLVLAEGDIDFIVAGPVLPMAGTAPLEFHGRTVSLDATAEILAKKLLYRADSFKARDVFDMAVALALDPASAHDAIAATRRAHPALNRRLSTLAGLDPATLAQDLLPSETGRRFLPGMVQTVQDAIQAGGRAS